MNILLGTLVAGRHKLLGPAVEDTGIESFTAARFSNTVRTSQGPGTRRIFSSADCRRRVAGRISQTNFPAPGLSSFPGIIVLMSIIAVILIGRIPLLAIVTIVNIYKHDADTRLHVQQILHLFCQ